VSNTIRMPFRSVGGFSQILETMRRRSQHRRIAPVLRQMDDYLLQDIGLTREDVDQGRF
jgi:uncharacterized protein YjiS (DUF1127 family)